MIKKFQIAVLILFIAASLANAQELLTLKDAVSRAIAANHDIKIAESSAEIADNNVHVGNAGLLPQVNLISSSTYTDAASETSTGTINRASTINRARIQASYTLFDGFGNIYSFDKLKINRDISELQLRSSIEGILFSVSEAYYNVCNSSENVRLIKESVEISKDRLQRAEKRNEFGQAGSIDVLSAQVDLNSDMVSLMNAEKQLNNAKRNLNLLLNRDIKTDFTPDVNVDIGDIQDEQTILELSMSNNADYLSSIKELEYSGLDIKSAAADYYPSLSFETSYGLSKSVNEFGMDLSDADRSFTAGLSLNFNLFNGNRTSINKQNAEINYRIVDLQKKKTDLMLRKTIANSYEAYTNSLDILDLQMQNLEAAELNFERTKDLFNLGQVTTATFREAQVNLISAKNNIAAARYDSKLYELDLLQLSGQLVNSDYSFTSE